MKRFLFFPYFASLAVLAVSPGCASECAAPDISGTPLVREAARPEAVSEETYYAVEVNGVVCGYAKFNVASEKIGGRDFTIIKEYFFAMISALGAKFNTEVRLTYQIDPVTGKFVYHDSEIDQADLHLESKIYVQGDTARFTTPESKKAELCWLPGDAVLENTLFFPHLKRDFVDQGLESKIYKVYEVRENEIQDTEYRKAGAETIILAGKKYDAVVLDELNMKTGIKARWWIDSATGRMLKTSVLESRITYLADESVVKSIELANLDETFLTRANVSIVDVTGITYMKVKGKLEPVGLWVTVDGLNVPGQKFEGTVEKNLIEGVFEIEHPRYDGSGAPLFPPGFSGVKDLSEFLEPSEFMESDDPVLKGKAEELTAGAKDSWEAACRLSRWVADNISYAIPGGGTARKTYDMRAGECGAHSLLLAAFCRSVGIPAKVVWGCMYTPNFGGTFGQHAWTEIYMGAAGWIPVDATAFETDYVDSGHIRIGSFESPTIALNAKSFEILDHRTLSGAEGSGADAEADTMKYAAYTGDYKGSGGDVFKVLLRDGSLGVDIPNRMVLLLNDPDEQGRRYAKLTNRIFVTFDEDESGAVGTMLLHEMIQLPRRADLDTIPAGAPVEMLPLLGKYYLAQAQAEFTVFIDGNGRLAMNDPLSKCVIGLIKLDEPDRYVEDIGENIISFVRDGFGKATMISIEAIHRFER